jgi:hypothetical protein
VTTRTTQPKKERFGCVLTTLLITAAVARIAAVAGSRVPDPVGAPAADKGDHTYGNLVLSMKAEDAVKSQLRDPESAAFRHEVVVRKENGVAVCGEVNVKSDSGAYMGFTQFVVIETPVLRTRENDAEFAEIWNKACR